MEPLLSNQKLTTNWDPPAPLWRHVVGGIIGMYVGFWIAYYTVLIVGPFLVGEDFNHGGGVGMALLAFPVGLAFGARFGWLAFADRPKLFLSTFLPLAILFGIVDTTYAVLRRIDRPREFVLELTGTAGAKFFGVVEVDRKTEKLEGVLPARFVYTALQLECAFALTDQKAGGKIAIATSINGKVNCRGNEYESGVHQRFESFGYSETFGGTSSFFRCGMLMPNEVEPLLKGHKLPGR